MQGGQWGHRPLQGVHGWEQVGEEKEKRKKEKRGKLKRRKVEDREGGK